LGDEYFRFEEASRAMVGTRTKETFRLGDAVQVRLVEAAPFAGALRFEIVRPTSESGAIRRAGASALRKPTYKGKRR
jgi:ribonuclease R